MHELAFLIQPKLPKTNLKWVLVINAKYKMNKTHPGPL